MAQQFTDQLGTLDPDQVHHLGFGDLRGPASTLRLHLEKATRVAVAEGLDVSGRYIPAPPVPVSSRFSGCLLTRTVS